MLKAWRRLTGTPADAVLVRPCPRCGADVRLTGYGPHGPGYGPPLYRPAVLHVARVCRCAAAGTPALPEWEQRRRRPMATYW